MTATQPPAGAERDPTTASVLAASVAVVTAVVAAAIRVLRDGWYPIGDNAYFALRSRDVLTEHHPLLGTWTSASLSVGIDVNNPGPLLFDVLAAPAKLDPDLLPLGVAAVVLGSVAVAAVAASRVAGRVGVLVTMVLASALAWAMGPELLVDPWQPHSLLFPFLALLVATWATCAGSDGSLVAVVGLGSLVVQTHLSYGPLVALLGGAAVTTAVVRSVRQRDRRQHAARMLAVAGVLGLVLWSQPLAEQLRADEQGNLSRIIDVAQVTPERTVGLTDGARVAGTLVSPVPQWLPSSFAEDFSPRPEDPTPPPPDELTLRGAPSAPVAAAMLLACAVLLAGVGVAAHRRRIPALPAAAGVGVLVVFGAVVSATALPVGVYGLPAHQVRWLWPLSIGVTGVLLGAVLVRRAGVVLVAAAAVLMSGLAMLPADPQIGPTDDGDLVPVLRDLASQLDGLRGAGPLVLAVDGLQPYEPYSIPVVLELAERDVTVHVEEPGLVRQLGPSRTATGDERGRLHVWQSEMAVGGVPGLERVAFASTLDRDDVAELERRTDEVGRWVERGALRLTPSGRRAVAADRLPDLEEARAMDPDPYGIHGARVFRWAAIRGFLEVPGHERDFARWVELSEDFDRRTVGVWVDWS